jgi:hypothetical protein
LMILSRASNIADPVFGATFPTLPGLAFAPTADFRMGLPGLELNLKINQGISKCRRVTISKQLNSSCAWFYTLVR